MWLLFAFCSAACLGFYDIFKKESLRDNKVMPVLFLNTLICSLLMLPMVLLSVGGEIGEGSFFYVPATNLEEQKYIMAKALLVLSSWALGYYAIKHLPLTIVGPVNATRPVLVLVGAMIIYGERLNYLEWIGVMLAVLSFFLLSRSGKKEGISFAHNRWIFCLVGAAVLGAMSGLYDKYLLSSTAMGGRGINRMVVQSWFNFYQCALMLIVLAVDWFVERKGNAMVGKNASMDGKPVGNKKIRTGETASVSNNKAVCGGETASMSDNKAVCVNETASVSDNKAVCVGETASMSDNKAVCVNETASVSDNQTACAGETASVSDNKAVCVGETAKKVTPFHWRITIPLISVFLTAADLLYFYALSLDGAMISVVSLARRGSVVVSFLFGALVLREKNLRAKTIDIILVLLGMLFLWLGSRG